VLAGEVRDGDTVTFDVDAGSDGLTVVVQEPVAV